MRHKNIQDLGKELDFAGIDLKLFSKQIRQYIVSSTAGKKFSPWPLVKIARIYVKSPVLRDGLVLVDIPGSMDTNAARNALARSYPEKSISQLYTGFLQESCKRSNSPNLSKRELSEKSSAR